MRAPRYRGVRVSQTLEAFMASLPPAMDCHGAISDKVLTKTMRDELALAVTRGVFPAGTKFSVRKNHYKSFTVEIVEWVGAVFVDAYVAHLMDPKGTEWDSGSGLALHADTQGSAPVHRGVQDRLKRSVRSPILHRGAGS